MRVSMGLCQKEDDLESGNFEPRLQTLLTKHDCKIWLSYSQERRRPTEFFFFHVVQLVV